MYPCIYFNGSSLSLSVFCTYKSNYYPVQLPALSLPMQCAILIQFSHLVFCTYLAYLPMAVATQCSMHVSYVFKPSLPTLIYHAYLLLGLAAQWLSCYAYTKSALCLCLYFKPSCLPSPLYIPTLVMATYSVVSSCTVLATQLSIPLQWLCMYNCNLHLAAAKQSGCREG